VNLGQLGGSVFISDELPDDLDLSAFDFKDFFVEQHVGPASWDARGSIGRFRRTIVPAPSAVAVLGLAVALRRRRRASAKRPPAGESHRRWKGRKRVGPATGAVGGRAKRSRRIILHPRHRCAV
jgi:hypothetical protein